MQVISESMSFWINVFRVQLSIWVIGSHYSSNANNYINTNTNNLVSNKWFNIFIPQPLMGIGIGAVSLFMLFSSFFLYNSFQKFYKLETKDFVKQFTQHWFKRYFQLRAVLIVQSLGYQQLLYYLFGGIGRDVYFNGPRDYKYWIHLYFPFFWPDRVWYTNKYISESSWYNLELINIEFFQYIYHFVVYFIQKTDFMKKYGQWFVFPTQFIIGLTLFLTKLTGISSIMYSIGYLMYQIRSIVVKKHIQIKSRKLRICLSIILLYLHEMLSRGCFILNFLPIFFMLVFDVLNFSMSDRLPLNEQKLPEQDSFKKKVKKIIDLYLKLQPSIYILHHPFLKEATPKYFDYLKSEQFSVYIGYLVIPYVVLQWVVLSIPLYFLQQPIENIPLYILKDKRKKIKVFDMICFGVFLILMILQIVGVYGQEQMQIPKLWENKCELQLCFIKSIQW